MTENEVLPEDIEKFLSSIRDGKDNGFKLSLEGKVSTNDIHNGVNIFDFSGEIIEDTRLPLPLRCAQGPNKIQYGIKPVVGKGEDKYGLSFLTGMCHIKGDKVYRIDLLKRYSDIRATIDPCIFIAAANFDHRGSIGYIPIIFEDMQNYIEEEKAIERETDASKKNHALTALWEKYKPQKDAALKPILEPDMLAGMWMTSAIYDQEGIGTDSYFGACQIDGVVNLRYKVLQD